MVALALAAVIQEARMHGVSTRPLDDLVKSMGKTGICKRQLWRLCGELAGRLSA